jgi:hypothetical protein
MVVLGDFNEPYTFIREVVVTLISQAQLRSTDSYLIVNWLNSIFKATGSIGLGVVP